MRERIFLSLLVTVTLVWQAAASAAWVTCDVQAIPIRGLGEAFYDEPVRFEQTRALSLKLLISPNYDLERTRLDEMELRYERMPISSRTALKTKEVRPLNATLGSRREFVLYQDSESLKLVWDPSPALEFENDGSFVSKPLGWSIQEEPADPMHRQPKSYALRCSPEKLKTPDKALIER